MKTMSKCVSGLAVGLAFFLGLEAPLRAAENSGTSSFSFLNIPTGARAASMGQAFTSIPNDVQGLVYNPASLATMAASQASFEHLSYVEGIVEEGIVAGHAGRDEGLSYGIQANYLHVGDITRTVASANTDGYTEAGDFSTYGMALGASAAGPLFLEGLSAGTTLKFLRESLADASSNGAAMDFGVVYQGNVERSWNLGASLLNFGTASKFADAAVKLPTTLRIGASGQPFAQWLFSTDFVKRTDTAGEFDIGAEVTPKKFFSMRVGYRYAMNNPDLGGLSNFSAGLGLRWNKASIDYAFVPLGDLGLTHRLSLNFRFKSRRS
jgi:hypothetical protein